MPASPVKISKDINVSFIIRDSSRRIVDEIYRHDSSNDSNYLMSLNVAVCLSSIGEGLMRCHQARDAMLRLEEDGVFDESLSKTLSGNFHKNQDVTFSML